MIYAIDLAKSVGQALQYVAPTHWGQRYLADNTKTAPRYVWVRSNDSVAAPTYVGYDDQKVAETACSFDVHCWGKTDRDAEELRALLINAFWQTIPRELFAFGGATWIEPENMTHGWVCVQNMTIRVPLDAVHVPDAPSEDTDSCIARVVVTSANLDHSGAVDGDGVLEWEDS